MRHIHEKFYTLVVQPVVSGEGCVACELNVLARSKKKFFEKLCSSSFFDVKMTMHRVGCVFLMPRFSRCHCVLYLIHMCLLNDVVYQEGNMRLIARCA